jgi:hypothetical protein
MLACGQAQLIRGSITFPTPFYFVQRYRAISPLHCRCVRIIGLSSYYLSVFWAFSAADYPKEQPKKANEKIRVLVASSFFEKKGWN